MLIIITTRTLPPRATHNTKISYRENVDDDKDGHNEVLISSKSSSKKENVASQSMKVSSPKNKSLSKK